jgi:hypothetical protein
LRRALLCLPLLLGLASLLGSLLLGLSLLYGRLLLLQLRNEFWDGHSVLLRIDSKLSLHRGDLLWSGLLSWADIERVARRPLRMSLSCHCENDALFCVMGRKWWKVKWTFARRDFYFISR